MTRRTPLECPLMSYAVYILPRRIQTKFKTKTRQLLEALEREALGEHVLDRFAEAEMEELTERLAFGWEEQKKTERGRLFSSDFGAEALLTPYALFLSCPAGSDAIFEISQWASEAALGSESFAKFDPQEGSWE
ncbi:hypothetical protein [Polyangium sp. 6x1]|uniref:hypothetical protein n=1 Tax=Polyangium sp. 6x1 TaxID=3042689 RepID=UPI0024825F5F|nr:hypothetical protein [Polyangium sp. 6x1]MDI1447991.1 hypothetical protein [Polyangium sp. 6x1]